MPNHIMLGKIHVYLSESCQVKNHFSYS